MAGTQVNMAGIVNRTIRAARILAEDPRALFTTSPIYASTSTGIHLSKMPHSSTTSTMRSHDQGRMIQDTSQ
jgi:hypothetical protein